eukprot:TRINITY_DN14269_c0_g1_i1.p1 TRINITY_DN14269_c0_g1~~TRINITY_DN14269_c0_g1_i1.p1  ORF type:complete len:881 (-),score=219.76 TRINITY_DN14269_c0_g1_i1:484-3126(-)
MRRSLSRVLNRLSTSTSLSQQATQRAEASEEVASPRAFSSSNPGAPGLEEVLQTSSASAGVEDAQAQAEATIAAAFERFDLDNDGVISSEELRCVLQTLNPTLWTTANVELLLRAVDGNGDGEIQYSEFASWVMGRSACQLVASELEEASRIAFGTELDPKAARADIDPSTEVRMAEAFFRFDANNDGVIDRAELAELLQNLDPNTWPDERVNMLLEYADVNRDNAIQYSEFIAWVTSKTAARKLADAVTCHHDDGRRDPIREAFRRFDTDGDGIITYSELSAVLSSVDPTKWNDLRVRALLSAADANGDGQIQYDEFLAWVMNHGDDLMLPAGAGTGTDSGGGSSASSVAGGKSCDLITVVVIRTNGQPLVSASLAPCAPVRQLRAIASKALGGQSCTLVVRGASLGNRSTLADANLHDGSTVTAVVASGVLQVASTLHGGYAALKADGSVVTWGSAFAGGDSTSVEALLREDVEHIFASGRAFAALRADNSLVIWGPRGSDSPPRWIPSGGACWEPVPAEDTHLSRPGEEAPANVLEITQVVATEKAFAALRCDGSVAVWGDVATHPDLRIAVELYDGVQRLCASDSAFAALKYDGSVVSWGAQLQPVPDAAVDSLAQAHRPVASGAVRVVATGGAFAALKASGAVVAWGAAEQGGNTSAVSHQLMSGVVDICASRRSFAALKDNGEVVTWGDPEAGGGAQLRLSVPGVEAGGAAARLLATDSAYAALLPGGSVVCWGLEGGDVSAAAVAEQLQEGGIVELVATSSAFAARRADGSVITWGNATGGGCSEEVASELRDVTSIVATKGAFAALRLGGSVVAWGSREAGGDTVGAGVAKELQEGVEHIFTTRQAFAALKLDGSLVMWGAGVRRTVAFTRE